MPEIRLESVSKIYKKDGRKQYAVKDVDLKVEQGEFVFLVGSSGAGKSTVLRLMAGELKPEEGTVFLDNVNISRYFGPLHFKLRRSFGQVWQDSNLMRKRTIQENMEMVYRAGGHRSRGKIAAKKALGVVGMPGVEEKYPAELSIGENRRVELARALVNSHPILLLDELTANLDDDNIWDVLHLLNELNRKGTTIVMATHASQFVNIMRRRVVTLVDGKILGDVRNGKYGDLV